MSQGRVYFFFPVTDYIFQKAKCSGTHPPSLHSYLPAEQLYFALLDAKRILYNKVLLQCSSIFFPELPMANESSQALLELRFDTKSHLSFINGE